MITNGALMNSGHESFLTDHSATFWITFGLFFFLFYPLLLELILTLVSFFTTPSIPETSDRIPIAYHASYNISAGGIEKCHPFDSQKYGKVYNSLIIPGRHLVPEKCPRSILRGVHPFLYLWSLCYSFQIFRAVEVPIFFLPGFLLRWRVLNPMLLATYGSIQAGCAAVSNGKWGINLGGGYHHASSSSCGGFCIYADITLTIYWLRKWYPNIKKVLIVDLDAHQGNGHERDFLDDPDTYIMDFYNAGIYPNDFQAKNAIRYQENFDIFHSDSVYLEKLKTGLRVSISEFRPDFLLYNAGTDCMEGDPLGSMSLTQAGIITRDELVFSSSIENSIPILMVLSGGYQMQNAPTISLSISNLQSKFNLF
jgi:histone deacetylase 11